MENLTVIKLPAQKAKVIRRQGSLFTSGLTKNPSFRVKYGCKECKGEVKK